MKLLNGPDDFPMYRLPGPHVHDAGVAEAILAYAKPLTGVALKESIEYFRLQSESARPFAYNKESPNSMVRGWSSMFAGHTLNGDEAVKTYRALSEVLKGCEEHFINIYTIVPAFRVNIDTATRHRITSIVQDGVLIVPTLDEWKPEGVYFSDDVSTSVIGCTKEAVEQFIKIANHLNSEPEDE